MTKKKETLAAPPAGDMPPDPIAEVEAMVASAIGQDRVMIYVSRRQPDGRERHVMKCTPDLFDVDEIARTYGGGEFRARIRNGDNTWGTGQAFGIEGEPITNAVRPASADARPRESDAGFMQTALLMLMKDRGAPAPAGPTFDPVAFAQALGSAQSAGMAQLAEIVGLKRDLEPKPAPDITERVLEALRMGMDIGRESGGNGDSPWSAIANSLSTLVQLAGKAKEAAPAPGAPGDMPSLETFQGPQLVPSPDPVSPFAQAIAILLPVAERGTEMVESWADVVAETVPGLDFALDAGLAQAGSVAALLDFAESKEPRMKPHRNFFARVVEYLTRDDGPADATEGGDHV